MGHSHCPSFMNWSLLNIYYISTEDIWYTTLFNFLNLISKMRFLEKVSWRQYCWSDTWTKWGSPFASWRKSTKDRGKSMCKALLKEYATPYEGAAVKSAYLSEVSTLLRRGPRTIRVGGKCQRKTPPPLPPLPTSQQWHGKKAMEGFWAEI